MMASLDALNEEFRREGLPVLARSSTFSYRAGKFVRRNKVAVLAATLVLLAIVGAANSVEDVALFTLLQRSVPDDTLTRVLGIFWGLAMGGVAIGSIAAPVIVKAVGPRPAFVVVGSILPTLGGDCLRLGIPHLRQSEQLRIPLRISTAFPLRPPRPLVQPTPTNPTCELKGVHDAN
jgi:MFS family permease